MCSQQSAQALRSIIQRKQQEQRISKGVGDSQEHSEIPLRDLVMSIIPRAWGDGGMQHREMLLRRADREGSSEIICMPQTEK